MKKILLILLLVFTIFTSINVAEAVNLGDALKMSKNVAVTAGYDASETGNKTFNKTLGIIINTALSLLGVVFLVLMIYGGFLWMTDRGNEQQLKRAQNLITAAVVGLIIVLSAYAVSYFVLEKLQAGTLAPAEGTQT